MQTKKKALFNVSFLLVVFGLTVYGVFHGEDPERWRKPFAVHR